MLLTFLMSFPQTAQLRISFNLAGGREWIFLFINWTETTGPELALMLVYIFEQLTFPLRVCMKWKVCFLSNQEQICVF